MNEFTPTTDRTPIPNTVNPYRLDEETLVADNRSATTPSELVEQRLIRMLKTSPVMVSQVQRRLKPGPR